MLIQQGKDLTLFIGPTPFKLAMSNLTFFPPLSMHEWAAWASWILGIIGFNLLAGPNLNKISPITHQIPKAYKDVFGYKILFIY
jgi:hypothetical protein